MARPKNTHSRRLAVMFKESEFACLEKLADMRGEYMAETIRWMLNREVARLKRNDKWDKDTYQDED